VGGLHIAKTTHAYSYAPNRFQAVIAVLKEPMTTGDKNSKAVAIAFTGIKVKRSVVTSMT
jgi:hypothetical protein